MKMRILSTHEEPSTNTESVLQAWAQPIVDIASNRIVAAELLARVRMGDGRIVYPGQFLEALLKRDRALSLDTQMIGFATAFLAANPDTPLDFISVNVDSVHIASGSAVSLVDEAIERTGADPKRLVLEATEYRDYENRKGWSDSVQALRSRGVRVALDDFGSGFSSMTRLIESDLDLVKIDRMLVSRCADQRCLPLLRGLVEYAARTNVAIVAEGVETLEHQLLAKSLGISAVQGFLYGRARPLTMLPAFWQSNGGVLVPQVPAPGIEIYPVAV